MPMAKGRPARGKGDAARRRAIRQVQKTLDELLQHDAREAQTSSLVEDVLTDVLGYHRHHHVLPQYAVHSGYADFALRADRDSDPVILVEVKRLGRALGPDQLKQVYRYSIDSHCDWIILTNGQQWQLHWVERTGRKPQVHLVLDWDMSDRADVLDEQLQWVTYQTIKQGGLRMLEVQTRVLAREALLNAIFSPKALQVIRSELRKATGHLMAVERLRQGLQRALNLGEVEKGPPPNPSDDPGRSMLDAAAEVLRRSRSPLGCREIIELMQSQRLWVSPRGKTPVQTLRAALMRDIQGESPRFVRVSRGRFSVVA